MLISVLLETNITLNAISQKNNITTSWHNFCIYYMTINLRTRISMQVQMKDVQKTQNRTIYQKCSGLCHPNEIKIYPAYAISISNIENHCSKTAYITSPYISASSWTYQGKKGDTRSYIYFDDSVIPEDFIRGCIHFFGMGHDPLTQSNACFIQRVTSKWNIRTINWKNQPNVSLFGKKILQRSTDPFQNYCIDITQWIKRWKSPIPGYHCSNHGLLLKLQTEDYYAKMNFGSTEYCSADKWPYLLINC